MKKSFIVSAFIGILMISFVSAGWFTGNAIWDWNHCSANKPCPASEGDCDRASDCLTGYCAQNVGQKYGQQQSMDVCECPFGSSWDGSRCSAGNPPSSIGDCYTKAEIDKMLQAIVDEKPHIQGSPSESFAYSANGNSVCSAEGKSCLFGTFFSKLLLDATDESTTIPGDFQIMRCDQTMQERIDLDETPSGGSIDYDVNWICY